MKIKSFINNLPMKRKLILSFSFVIIIPIIISFYFKTSLQISVLNNAQTQAVNSIERVTFQANQLLNSIATSSYNITYDPNLNNVLTANYKTEYDMVVALRNNNVINTYVKYDKSLAYVKYYVDSQRILDTGYITNTPTEIAESDWYQKCKIDKTIFWGMIENPSFVARNSKSMDLTIFRPSYVRG